MWQAQRGLLVLTPTMFNRAGRSKDKQDFLGAYDIQKVSAFHTKFHIYI